MPTNRFLAVMVIDQCEELSEEEGNLGDD